MRRVSGWDLAFWIIMVAILATLVHPGSKAGTIIPAITGALAAVVGQVTGYTQPAPAQPSNLKAKGG